MSDLFDRLSKLVGPGAARNMLTSVPDEEDDDIFEDFTGGIKNSELAQDASDYYNALMVEQEKSARPLKPFSPQAPLGGLGKPENPYNQGPEVVPPFLQPEIQEPNASTNPNFKPELVQQQFLNPLNAPEQPGFSPVTDQTFKQQVPQAQANPAPIPVEVPGSPKPVPVELMKPEMGNPSIASLENLLAAQEAANNVRSASTGLQALDRVSAGIAGLGANAIIKPSGQDLFKQQAEAAGQPIADYKDLVAMEKHDAKSPVSRSLQAYGKKLGFDMTGLSAADAEKVMPYVFKGFEAEEGRKARKEELSMRLKEMNERFAQQREARKAEKDEKDAYKQEKDTITRLDKAGKALTAELASSRSSFGRMANNLRSAEAIEKLFEGRDPNSIDIREVYELAGSLDQLLTQGQSTISGREHLIPKTFWGDAAKIKEYLTNIRQPAKQKSFIKQMLKTVERERDLAKDQVKRTQRKILANFADLREKAPDEWKILMKQHDLPEDPFADEEKPKSEDLNAEFDKF